MRSGNGNLVAQGSERKPVFFAARAASLALILVGGITGAKSATAGGAIDAGAFDASAPPSGPFSALVGIVVGGQLTCTGVLVDARLVVTAASCLPPSGSASTPLCLAIAGVCSAAPSAHLDPSGQVAAFVLPADALAQPITYGRGVDTPVAGDAVSIQGYDDPASLVGTLVASNATTYTAILGSGADDAEGSFQPADLGSPFTYTPPASADGTLTTAVYGILVSLPAADAGANGQAVYARLDALAASFLDPLVQGTRTDPDEGCR
jgi:hypothetical protein